jgi:nitrogen regulatory protein P-II 1
MDVVLVVAIIRSLALERVERTLHGMGVRGLTVSRVQGYGEHPNFFALNHKIEQVKVEVFVERERADAIVQGVLDTVHTGMPGDGLVAILPVEKVFSGRTRAEVVPNRWRA